MAKDRQESDGPVDGEAELSWPEDADCRLGGRGGEQETQLVRRVQEWLCLRGAEVSVDGHFGPATEQAVEIFQHRNGIAVNGVVTRKVWESLTEPMRRAVTPIQCRAADPLGTVAVQYARQHAASGPREVGGRNRGPWVRLYMNGRDGDIWEWCAGTVSFLLRCAAQGTGRALPFALSFGVPDLARRSEGAGLFVPGHLARRQGVPVGSLFLVKRAASWGHVGIVLDVDADGITTYEGNTNAEGSRVGDSARIRRRPWAGLDFALVDRK